MFSINPDDFIFVQIYICGNEVDIFLAVVTISDVDYFCKIRDIFYYEQIHINTSVEENQQQKQIVTYYSVLRFSEDLS